MRLNYGPIALSVKGQFLNLQFINLSFLLVTPAKAVRLRCLSREKGGNPTGSALIAQLSVRTELRRSG